MYVFMYLCITLSPFHVIFVKAYFAPTSRSRMTNILRDFALQNMVETTLPDGLETSGRRVYR